MIRGVALAMATAGLGPALDWWTMPLYDLIEWDNAYAELSKKSK